MSEQEPIPVDRDLIPLATTDLLPMQFREQRIIERTIYLWSLLVFGSIVILMGTIGVFLARAKQIRDNESQLIADAKPLMAVRDDVVRLRTEITTLKRSCSLVETSRPGDDVLQSLAAIARASDDEHESVMIDVVDIRLPLEFSESENPPPAWAKPELFITASVTDHQATERWVTKINESDRFQDATIESSGRSAIASRLTVTAMPLATRVLP